MPLVVKSTSVKNVTSGIYTGAPLKHEWHARFFFFFFFFIDFSMLLQGDVIRYELDSFHYCNKCLADKNIYMNEKRFCVKKKYIPMSVILSNQPTRFLGYKHRINQVLNLCGGREARNKVSDLIKKGKCAKCNDYVCLGNDNHVSTYVVHNNNGCWKVETLPGRLM